MSESIDGVIARKLYHKPSKYNPAGVPFFIGRLTNGTTVKGEMRKPVVGEQYRFWGSMMPQKGNYGDAFEFHSYEAICDRSEAGITTYLVRQVDGIGTVKAARLVEAFGADTLDILRSEPEKALVVPGITEEIVEGIRAHFADSKQYDPAAYARLIDLFSNYRISERVVKLLLKAFGSNAPDTILDRPYLLLDYPRTGWKTTDCFALSEAEYDRDGIERHQAGIIETLERAAAEGHTCMTWSELTGASSALLGGRVAPEALDALIADGEVVESEDDFGSVYQLASLAEAEGTVATKLAALMEAGKPMDFVTPEWSLEVGLGDDQTEAALYVERFPVVIVTGAPGVGKAQPLDAKILTPTGWITMGGLKVGDRVIGSDGKACRVTGVFPQGMREIFRITFDDGAAVECCEDHLWSAWTRLGRLKGRSRVVKSLREIMRERSEWMKVGSPHYFPMVSPVEFDPVDLPLDPYALGVLLGDGSIVGGQPKFSKPDSEIHEMLIPLLPEGMIFVSHGNGKDFGLSGPGSAMSLPLRMKTKNPLVDILDSLGLWGRRSFDKFLPDIYKFSSIESRIALLNGLLDTDGFPDRSSVEYSTSSEQLASDFQFLVESLGGKARIGSRVPVYTYAGEKKQGRTNYRIFAVLPENIMPFRLSRKSERHLPRKIRHPVRTIDSIDSVGMKPSQCIAIDSPDSLYVTNNCVITHNTYTISRIVGRLIEKGVTSIRACSPTGKAAKRMAELLAEVPGCSAIPSTTIHRALEPVPASSKEGVPSDDARFGRGRPAFGFQRNEDNPLDSHIVIIDELSMVDCRLMASLLRAIKPGTRLICVGDSNQLPSVGPGSVLRDMVAAGVPTATLTQIRRSDGGGTIVHACHAIKDGEILEPAIRVSLPTENWVHIEISEPREIAEKIVNLCTTTKTFDKLWGIQVISPQKARLPIGCDNLNRMLSRVLNPENRPDNPGDFSDGPLFGNGEEGTTGSSGTGSPGGESEDGPEPAFRVGDKVVRTKNGIADELIEWDEEPALEVPPAPEVPRIYRGEHEFKLPDEFDPYVPAGPFYPEFDPFYPEFDHARPEVKIPESPPKKAGSNFGKSRPDFRWQGRGWVARPVGVVNGDLGQIEDIILDGKPSIIVRFRDPDRLCRLPYGDSHIILAYALTVHKMQGSGAPYIIFPLHHSFFFDARTGKGLWNRELVYTAISRSEQLLVTVGRMDALATAIGRKTVNRRKTTLAKRLKQRFEQGPGTGVVLRYRDVDMPVTGGITRGMSERQAITGEDDGFSYDD